ncbi:hypothetical protein CY34DRAFT_164656 [Suillus luteus UH-Slu-Lm8-n1]|uniref:DUF6533 domain-containing protein n=1 Tax=Suillus luteus UH-Slu-Lm8-n1 TaxID=930992 RepID=A0A0C9ZWA5_9AGAM|nr:hypothetical protein CY34DRAFT_164656 [Suillus luteus UH-Slu-Lm8-n1]
MTIVSNDPIWWSTIDSYRFTSYFIVASFVAVTYDWALTFGQEVELIWRQRWSLMTVLYLTVRYLGMSFVVFSLLIDIPTISMTDIVSSILYNVLNWINVVVSIMLGVIMITRIHAMYQRSRKIQIFLIVIFLVITMFGGVACVIITIQNSGEVLILSGTYLCTASFVGDALFLSSITWILGTVWEVLALCLAVWIAVKHFRELQKHSAGGIIGDCFTVLIRSHVVYFMSFTAISCFSLAYVWTPILTQYSLGSDIYAGLLQILTVVQSFVLGPRLILDVREYHAELVADSDAVPGMTSIALQERVHVSTGSGV